MIFNVVLGSKDVTATLDPGYPVDITVTAGDEASFKVVVTDVGFPRDHTFQWFVNEKAIEGATEDNYTRDTSEDKGVYSVRCEVKNKAGTAVSKTAMLTVKKLPVLDESFPQDASAIIAKNATFEARISETGYPDSYTYQWYVNENKVDGATGAIYTRTAPAVGTENIYCMVTNEAGTVKSRTATFTISKEDIVVNSSFTDGSTWGTYLSGGEGSILLDSYGEGCLRMHVDGPRSGYAWSSNQYDFDGKNKLVFFVRHFSNVDRPHNTPIYFGVSDTGADGAFIASTMVAGHTGNDETVVVDVSSVSGKHLIKFGMTRTEYNADLVYLEDVWFE